MSEVTMAQMDELCRKYAQLKHEKEEIEAVLKDKSEEIRDVQMQLNAVLELMELGSFKSKHGTIIRSERWSVRTPKDPDSKKAFFDFLKERDLYDQMITVNSQTLNALYNQERKALNAEGKENPVWPGIEPGEVSYTISLRKG
jgi:glycyl-tRNA synthetase beta subunit